MSRSSQLSLKDKSPAERRAALSSAGLLEETERKWLDARLEDWAERLNAASENVIGAMPMTWSIAPHFRVNGEERLVPMCINEQTVVAAASKAAKMALPEGFEVKVKPRRERGHFYLVAPRDGARNAALVLAGRREQLIAAMRERCDPMAKHGGGLSWMDFQPHETRDGDRLVVSLDVDTVDAQGARVVLRMAEAAAKLVREIVGGEAMGAICDNAAPGIGAYAKCVWRRGPALDDVRIQRLLYIAEWAGLDDHRAATHNKGVMNGVIAVCAATGQDLCAVYEAAAHEARRSGECVPLSRFKRSATGDLIGRLFLPLQVATVGGATSSETAARSFRIMGIDTRETGSSRTLAEIVAAVGLAQNFAALYQLASPEGFSATYGRIRK